MPKGEKHIVTLFNYLIHLSVNSGFYFIIYVVFAIYDSACLICPSQNAKIIKLALIRLIVDWYNM